MLLKGWENVSINSRRTEKATTAVEAIARFEAKCAMDKDLRSKAYWQEFIDHRKYLGVKSRQLTDYHQQAEESSQAGDHRTALRVLFHALAIDP